MAVAATKVGDSPLGHTEHVLSRFLAAENAGDDVHRVTIVSAGPGRYALELHGEMRVIGMGEIEVGDMAASGHRRLEPQNTVDPVHDSVLLARIFPCRCQKIIGGLEDVGIFLLRGSTQKDGDVLYLCLVELQLAALDQLIDAIESLERQCRSLGGAEMAQLGNERYSALHPQLGLSR